MAVVFIKDEVKSKDLKTASEEYGNYIKVVVDIKTKKMAIGGEWHADAEKWLLKIGSKQENIWGGGINIKNRKIDTVALINVRPNQDNPSQDVLDKDIRKKFINIVQKKFGV